MHLKVSCDGGVCFSRIIPGPENKLTDALSRVSHAACSWEEESRRS
jgi:hypothetical protein